MNSFKNANLCTITYKQVQDAMNGEPFTMSLVGNEIVTRLVNQGIDGHLEACFVPERGDSYTRDGFRLNCKISPESLPVLLRRLFEDGDETSLGESILETLGFSESGVLKEGGNHAQV
jgi:hypothetical protein